MLEICIKIDGKEYTREQAETLFNELAEFLGKPTVKTVIEKVIVEKERVSGPWVNPYPRYSTPDSTPWLPKVTCHGN